MVIVKRTPILIFLLAMGLLPLYCLEEQSFQARILVKEEEKLSLQFPLPPLNLKKILTQYSEDSASYLPNIGQEDIILVDLCKIQDIEDDPKGDLY